MAIKKLQNNFTTPEQSKRLLELGVPVRSADCYYMVICGRIDNQIEVIHDFDAFIDSNEYLTDYFPCWSAGRLMEIYTNCYQPDNDLGESLTFTRNQDYIDVLMKVYEEGVKYGDIDFSKLEE